MLEVAAATRDVHFMSKGRFDDTTSADPAALTAMELVRTIA